MSNKANDLSAKEWYIENRTTYKKMAEKVASIILEVLNKEGISYYTISSRAKDIESFVRKSENDKYENPKVEIMDMAGIRIITYVKSEVQECCEALLPLFDIDDENSADKTEELGDDKVGYRSVHYIAKFKKDRLELPEYKIYQDLCFEIQVRTILEHAWADISHDRNYKFSGILPKESGISRRFALASAALEMVDNEFDSLVREIDTYQVKIENQIEQDDFNISINTMSLKKYLSEKFSEQLQSGDLVNSFTDRDGGEIVVAELSLMGIDSISKLDTIIEKNKENYFEISYRNFIGFLRTVMLIHDADEYFNKAWRNDWTILDIKDYEYLKVYIDNIDELIHIYDIIIDP